MKVIDKKLIYICLLIIILIGFVIYSKLINKKGNDNMIDNEIQTGIDKLLYMGKASIRIITSEGKVIYIDPYAGDGYDLNADLILVTHKHYDHNDIDKVRNRNNDVKIITNFEALENNEHQTFDLGYVKVEAVEAGYKSWHNVKDCVGYVLTLSSGIKIYVAGDTYLTPQMEEMKSLNIDYAFFPCDGVYTMNMEEVKEAADKVGAKHNIPYHMVAGRSDFDMNVAREFKADNRLIIKNNETIILERGV